jgi:uncharacterized protein (TIGR02145 family)
MTVIITLTTAGADTGPFNLFSDADGYTSAFALGISKAELEAGYPSDLVPDGTTTVKIQSVNSLCNNFILLPTGITTTTTSSTSTTTSTTTLCVSCCDVTIGAQIWTTCNLDVSNYNNGDPIPEVTDPTAWAGLTTGAWCYYNNDSANGPIYGKLYNWYAINDTRGIIPTGYHVPLSTDYYTLITNLGGINMGYKLKESGTTHWISPNTGTNITGFTALPGGVRSAYDGAYNFIGINGVFWSADEDVDENVIAIQLQNNLNIISVIAPAKENGLSIRLIKD